MVFGISQRCLLRQILSIRGFTATREEAKASELDFPI